MDNEDEVYATIVHMKELVEEPVETEVTEPIVEESTEK